MNSSGMLGVAGGILAIQFAPRYEFFDGVPVWAVALLVVMAAYLFSMWRSAATAGHRPQAK